MKITLKIQEDYFYYTSDRKGDSEERGFHISCLVDGMKTIPGRRLSVYTLGYSLVNKYPRLAEMIRIKQTR